MLHLVLVLVQVLFATLGIAAKLALRELPVSALVLLRVFGASLALAILLTTSRLPAIRGAGDYMRLALYSLLGVVLNQLLFVKGLSFTTAINANILITTVPVFTLGVAVLLGVERASFAGVIGLLLAIAGALTLVDPAQFETSPRLAIGNAMIVLNALSYAVYLVISKDMLRRHPPLTVTTWVFVFGAVGVLPFGIPALADVDPARVAASTWLLVLYIVVGPTVTVYWLSLWALARAESSLVAIYIYVQPLVTMLIAPAFLGERVEAEAIVGGAAIFAGIALVALQRRRLASEAALRETGV